MIGGEARPRAPMRASARGPALIALFAVALFAAGCGAPAAAPPPKTPTVSRQGAPWFGAVVDPSRDFVVELAPRDLRRDAAYGPLFRRALTLAAASGGPLHGSTLDVLAEADDVVVAVRGGPRGPANDVVVVVAGVPASLDPRRLLTDSGEEAFVPRKDVRRDGDVAELVARRDQDSEEPTTLFVVPGRTWIVGVGVGAPRVRSALERSAPATAYLPDPHALASVSLGADVLDRVRARVGPALAPITRGLVRLTLALSPGVEGRLTAELVYVDARAASDATPRVRETVAALVERWLPGVAAADWLDVRGPSRPGASSVEVVARVPTTVLEALAHPDDPPSPPSAREKRQGGEAP